MYTLGELAERIGAEVAGDAARRIEGVRTLADAGPEHLSFLTSPKYLDAAKASSAGAILMAPPIGGAGPTAPAGASLTAPSAALAGRDLLLTRQPQLALAKALELFHPRPAAAAGIHPTAIVGEGARIDPTAAVGPYAVIGRGVEIGERSVIHAHAVIGDGCRLGADVVLHPHVVLYAGVALGERAVVHSGSVLGADGFGYATVGAVHHKIPQVGGVEIGADVEIGALTAIDRALLGATRIGAGTKIDNLVQVGHNVEVGESSVLCGQAGIAGSAKLGRGVVLAGQAGVSGHLELGDGAQVAAKSAALESVPRGAQVAGIPAVPLGVWRRQQAIARRLPRIWRRLLRLERHLGLDEVIGREERSGSDDGNES